MDLATELQKIYDSEINVEIGWLWDGGIDVRLGDQMNGYLAEENVASVTEILQWLQEAIAHFYPTSTYAIGLDPGIRERAARQIFSPPRTGARVLCPHCGAPNPAPAMDKVFIFYCFFLTEWFADDKWYTSRTKTLADTEELFGRTSI